MDLAVDPHRRLIDALLAFGDLKVWSVLVTIFGDLAPARGSFLPGTFLTGLTSDLGIRPEAQRVALHRLRKDGWIDVEKDGRVSLYALSALARRETRAVQSRVFDAHVPRPETVTLIVEAPGGPHAARANWLPLGSGVFLSDGPVAPEAGLLISPVAVADLPDWARRAAISDDIQVTYGALTDLLATDPAIEALSESKRLALRVLILHRWRRLVLSHSRSASHVMGPDWIGNPCRTNVQRWLHDLPRPSRGAIEAH